mgnify:CR=1 FL=1
MFTTKNLLILIGRHALIALGAVIISLIAVFLLAQNIERISTTAVKNRRLTHSLEQRAELFTTITHEVEFVGENGARIENAFVPSDNILGFIATLEDLALTSAVAQSFRFGTPAGSSLSAPFPLATIPFSVTVSANLPAIIAYLERFEKLPYMATIGNISISSSDTAGWFGSSTGSFNAILYARGQE